MICVVFKNYCRKMWRGEPALSCDQWQLLDSNILSLKQWCLDQPCRPGEKGHFSKKKKQIWIQGSKNEYYLFKWNANCYTWFARNDIWANIKILGVIFFILSFHSLCLTICPRLNVYDLSVCKILIPNVMVFDDGSFVGCSSHERSWVD